MAEPAPHFIGWLPMPRALARFLAPVAVGLVVGAGVLAGVLAVRQHSPGRGRWDEQSGTLEGVAYAEPYAMLRVPGANGAETVLLVDAGKHGAKDRVKPFDGRPVRVSGTVLQRDGRRMLELSPGESGLRPVEMSVERQAALERPTPTPIGTVTLVGEIVDSKCYLGAMKPGEGRAHRGCAVLCLRGGVPPMFVSADAGGTPVYHLLTNSDRRPLSHDVFGRVGERLTVTAELERWGDLRVLKVRPDDVSP